MVQSKQVSGRVFHPTPSVSVYALNLVPPVAFPLAQWHSRGRKQLPRQELRGWQVSEAAWAARAAMRREFSHGRARLPLLEAASGAKIPAWEGLERQGVWREAA